MSENVLPTVSVVTIVYNRAKTIGATIESVLRQDYPNIEYIIIDGASSDGTMDVVLNYRDRISCIFSERDTGVPQALNRGLMRATGEWVYFLNSDDVFYSNSVVSNVFRNEGMRNLDGIDLILGRVQFVDGKEYISRFDSRLKIRNTVHHQGTFYRTSALRNIGHNESLKVYADYELNLTLYLKGGRAREISHVIAVWARGGMSDASGWKEYAEEIDIRKRLLVPHEAFVLNFSTYVRFLIKAAKKRFSRLASPA